MGPSQQGLLPLVVQPQIICYRQQVQNDVVFDGEFGDGLRRICVLVLVVEVLQHLLNQLRGECAGVRRIQRYYLENCCGEQCAGVVRRIQRYYLENCCGECAGVRRIQRCLLKNCFVECRGYEKNYGLVRTNNSWLQKAKGPGWEQLLGGELVGDRAGWPSGGELVEQVRRGSHDSGFDGWMRNVEKIRSEITPRPES